MRTIWLRNDLADYLTLPYANAVLRLERERSNLPGGSSTREVVYGVTSHKGVGPSDAEQLQGFVRLHWAVENRLHWVRDVTFDEDQSQVRKGNGPRMMATLRNLAISVLRLAGAQSIAAAIRWCSRHPAGCQRLLGLP